MTSEAELAAAYTRARPRLMRVAYAVTGSYAEAEDVVSDCWLRLVAADANAPVKNVEFWGTVVVARRALDSLRSARVRRETYVGPWLPEPWVDSPSPADPADRVALDDYVSFAPMVAPPPSLVSVTAGSSTVIRVGRSPPIEARLNTATTAS